MEMRQSTAGRKCQHDYSGEQLKTMILNMELAYGVHVENADDSNCVLKGTHLLVIKFVLSSSERGNGWGLIVCVLFVYVVNCIYCMHTVSL